jgi:hypothetical protein
MTTETPKVPDREIVAIRAEDVGGHQHIVKVKLADGTEQDAADVIAAIEAHEAHYVMALPPNVKAATPEGAEHLPLLIRTRQCPDCEKTVIWG